MSETLRIDLPENPPVYEPRQEIVGTLSWQRAKPFSSIHLHLFWHTSGKGDEDSSIVETLEWKSPGAEGDRFFEIRLPRAPYSIKSENLQIHWHLEAVGQPGNETTSVALTMAPGGQSMKLETMAHPDEPLAKMRKWLGFGTRAE